MNGEFMRLGSVADNYRKLQGMAEIEPKGILVKNVKSRLKNAFGKKVDLVRWFTRNNLWY